MVPEGYQALFRASPYPELIGPLYSCGQGAALQIGLRAERKHCNQRDFAGAAREGDWLETRVDIQKQGSRLAFGNCYITSDGERIVRASAVFLVAGTLAET